MKGWLAVNAFLIVLALISAGIYLVLGSIVSAFHLSHGKEFTSYGIAAVLALLGCGYFGSRLHRWIGRRLIRR